MAINWTENKVFNPNAPQKMPMNERTNVNNATRPLPGLQEDNMPMDKYGGNQNRMNENMMNKMIIEDQLMNDMMTDRQGPPPVMNKEYIAGYLKENIGRNVRAEFPMAGGFFIDKAGILREVGVNYFVLEDTFSRARILCDLYSVKFVTIV